MPDPHSKPGRIWTVAEAKARLSEVLRLSEEEGPQHIGRRRSFVVVSAADWYAKTPRRPPLGQWLVDNMPRGTNLDPPGDRKSARTIPFAAGESAGESD